MDEKASEQKLDFQLTMIKKLVAAHNLINEPLIQVLFDTIFVENGYLFD